MGRGRFNGTVLAARLDPPPPLTVIPRISAPAGRFIAGRADRRGPAHGRSYPRRWKSAGRVPFYGAPRPEAGVGPSGSLLSPLQRIGVAVYSAATALSDPTRADAVAALGEVTGHVALCGMYDRMMRDPAGQRILRDRPVVDSSAIDLDALLMPEGSERVTFGHAYATFMKGHDFDPDERDQVRFVSDPELAYIMLRYRQCHDFWHTLTGLPPTVLGELALKWLEVIQTGLPVAALSATVGSLRLASEERDALNGVYLPWAVRVGKGAPFLMNVYYEEEFETCLDELRERLGIEPAPTLDI